MNAVLSIEHPGNGAANRAPEVIGVMPPGLSLLGFRDGDRLAFRDAALRDRQPRQSSNPQASDCAFPALVAIGSIALLALGR